jgi:hypothetical protein
MLIVPLLLALSGPLVTYEVRESVTAVTPRGEQAQALVGRIAVAGDRALWELTTGTFPRSTAQAALADRGGITLLDRKLGTYASASRDEFDALFVPRTAVEMGASFTPRDVAALVEPLGSGSAFGEAATRRWRVTASWTLDVKTPGRAGEVKTTLSGTIVAAPDLAEAKAPFDDLLRLLPARGDVRDALERELARIAGLPVKVDLELVSEAHVEQIGSGGEARDRTRKPPRTVTRIRRDLSAPVRRAARDEDAPLFAVPSSFHAKALEVLAPAPALP